MIASTIISSISVNPRSRADRPTRVNRPASSINTVAPEMIRPVARSRGR